MWAAWSAIISVETRIGRWSGDDPEQGLPVDVVGVIGTSWAGEPGTEVQFVLYGAAGGTMTITLTDQDWYGERGLLQTIVALVDPADEAEALIAANCCRVDVVFISSAPRHWGTRDPYRDSVEWDARADLPSVGCVWAGPVWRPQYGVAIRGASETIIDSSDARRALSGSFRAAVRPRLRRQSGQLALVSHDERLRVPDGLREMTMHAGTSRPVLMHAGRGMTPIYGVLDDPITWGVIDATSDGIVGVGDYSLTEIR